MLRSQWPWGHAFLDKYRPRAPGGLQLQRPGKGETKSLRVPAKGSRTRGLLSPNAAQAAATRGGERRLEQPPLHLYPPAPGAAGRRAPRDLGAVVPAHSARGPEAGRPHESDLERLRGATATPGVRRTGRSHLRKILFPRYNCQPQHPSS
ncbi:hypothetical protein NN561_013424 [Cricetulus griseus]